MEAIKARLDAHHGDDRMFDGLGVWPENTAAVEAFLAAATQWRSMLAPAGHGFRLVWLGFDYAGVRAGLAMAGIAVSAGLFTDLRVMEAAARDIFNGETA